MTEIFYPNEIMLDDIDDLEPWQLLVAACHFGDTMDDCVVLNYGYTLEKGDIICHTPGTGPSISLKDDIDIHTPMNALKRYADFDWKKYARDKITREFINEYRHE